MVFPTQKTLVEALTDGGETLGGLKPTSRMANFSEKGDKPLEIITSCQWYIRSGGRDHIKANGRQLRGSLIVARDKLAFYPDFMHMCHDNWVGGLNTGWLISRQRFFSMPTPLWYRVCEPGEVSYDDVTMPGVRRLPVDLSSDVPESFSEVRRGGPDDFVGRTGIMGTWAASSLNPQTTGGWLIGKDLFSHVYPVDAHPWGWDIICTWLFPSMVRAHLGFGENP